MSGQSKKTGASVPQSNSENEVDSLQALLVEKDAEISSLAAERKQLEREALTKDEKIKVLEEALKGDEEKDELIASLQAEIEALKEQLETTKVTAKATGPTFEVEAGGKVVTYEVVLPKLNIMGLGVISAVEFVSRVEKGDPQATKALTSMLKGSAALRVIARKAAKKGGK
jgi:predicted RNase H-like nuclease (RuvC/YqgF family)